MLVDAVDVNDLLPDHPGVVVDGGDRVGFVFEVVQFLDEPPVAAQQIESVKQPGVSPQVEIVHQLFHVRRAVEQQYPATDVFVARQHIVPDVVVPDLRLVQVYFFGERKLPFVVVFRQRRAVDLDDHVEVFLRTGVSQLQVEPVELRPAVRQFVDVFDPRAQFGDLPADRFAFGDQSAGDAQRPEPFLKLDDFDSLRVLFVEQRLFFRFFEDLGALPEQSLVVQDAGEVDLFAKLDRNRALRVEQPDADQDLFVEVRLHVRQLFLLDRAALEDFRFVVFVQRVHAVEKRNELRFLVAGQAGGVEFEVALLRLAHAPDQVVYGLLFSSYDVHLFRICNKQNYEKIQTNRNLMAIFVTHYSN